jgi:disulfide bond formation protein DsbB
MTPKTAQLFFSLLTLVSMGLALIVLAPWVARSWRPGVWGAIAPLRLPLAAAVAGTAMIGSLYFSEVANYEPCTLCWYQRIVMYPSAIMLAIAAWRRDLGVRVYLLPLLAIGGVVATYHYLLERFPDTLETSVCSVGIPCSAVWFEQFGFITLPLMALVGFCTIAGLLVIPASAGLVSESE